MWIRKFAFIALLLPGAFLSAEEASFSLKDFSGGLYSNQSANRVPDNAVTAMENFYSDIPGECIERNGYEKRDSTILGGTKAVTGLWEFVDNTGVQWVISFSSQSYYKNALGDTPTKFGQNTTVDTPPDCAVNLGKIWCVNGTDSLWWFDGTSTGTVASAPVGTLIEPWRTRLVIANISGSQSTVRFSEDGDGTSWTIATEPTDPFSIEIGGANDGFNVTCLWGSYLDNLIISRKKDTWYVSGFDQEDVETRNISKEIGCIQAGTMREFDGSLLFLSNRGMEEMRGITITPISEPIRNITDDLIKNTASVRTDTFTSQDDFDDGTVSPSGHVSVTQFPGSVNASTFGVTQTLSADFNGTHAGTVASGDAVKMAGTTNKNFFHERDGSTRQCYSFETSGSACFGSDAANTAPWVENNGADWLGTMQNGSPQLSTDNCGTLTARTGTTQLGLVKLIDVWNVKVRVVGISGDNAATPVTVNYSANQCSWSANTLTISSTWTNRAVYILAEYSGGGSQNLESQFFISSGNNITFYTRSDTVGSNRWLYFDDFTGGVTESTGAYTTAIIDSGISTNTVSITTFGVTSNDFTPVFTLQTSHNGTTWTDLTSSTNSNSVGQRYYRFISSFTATLSQTSAHNALSTLNNFSLVGIGSGTYTSPAISIGSLISSWGPLTIDSANNGGSIQFQFNTSTSPNIASFNASSWTTVTSGQIPTNSTDTYAAFRSSFNVTAATHTPILNSFQLSWNEGGTGSQPLVSWNFDRRYWLAYTTATVSDARNDRVLIYQRNRTWTIFKLPISSFATWRDKLYFGDANDTGYVYKFDVGNTDDGNSVTSVLRTKSYDLGEVNSDKEFRNAYVNYFGNTSFTGNYSLTYDLDRNGGIYELGTASMDESSGQIAAKFPFPISNPIVGKEIQYTLIKSGTGDRLKLYDIRTHFEIGEPD